MLESLILLSVQTSPHACGEIKHLPFISTDCSLVSYVVSNSTIADLLIGYVSPVITLPYWEMLQGQLATHVSLC